MCAAFIVSHSALETVPLKDYFVIPLSLLASLGRKSTLGPTGDYGYIINESLNFLTSR
jgi:hypothetical protein